MIYLDTSVALAELLAEDRHPESDFWQAGPFVSSRLLEYEVWTRVNRMGVNEGRADDVRQLLAGVAFLELAPPVLSRALEPFPTAVRTLDALHLSSIEFLRSLGQRPSLATYDRRLAEAAIALEIPIIEP